MPSRLFLWSNGAKRYRLSDTRQGLNNNPSRLTSAAEREGFEPPIPRGMPVFKTGAISRTLPPLQG